MKAETETSFPEPHPHEGWSREVVRLENATIWPAGKLQRHPVCGVLDKHDKDVPESAIYRGLTRMMMPAIRKSDSPAKLKGRHIWGGQVFAHFGHFLCESIARLWAARLHEADSIVFIGRHEDLRRFSPWQERFLELMDLKLPVQILTEPTEVEELLVPGQGFGLGMIARGTPEFRNFMRPLADRVKADGSRRIYISRTHEGKKGRVLNELKMERNFEKLGYEIFHPQEHSLEEQLAHYASATHIIGLDSSAFHLCGFVARPEQKIGIILRRNMLAYYNIQRQLEGMMGHDPDIINALEGDWLTEKQKAPGRLSWGQVDHAELARQMAAAGYIDAPEDWEAPTEAEYEKALANYKKRMRQPLKFVPVETPIHDVMAGRL